MARSWLISARIMCLALFVALTGPALQPAGALAAGPTITLTPNAGPVGSAFAITGSGFNPGSVTVFFNTALLGTATVSNTGIVSASFTVPSVTPNLSYNVAICPASGPALGCYAIAVFHVTTASSLSNLGLSKFIQTGSGFTSCPSGGGCTVQNVAGATETYAIQYQNSANVATSQLTITDTLQPGQLFVSASPGCAAGAPAPSTALVTVTCTVASVPANGVYGSTNSVTITTRPASGFTGVLTNQACASEAGLVGQVCSNTTYLTVNGNVITTGTQVCGLVTAYTAPSFSTNGYGFVTIGGQTFTIAPTAQITGAISTAAGSNNVCITFTIVNSAATVLTVTPNLALVNVVCGAVTSTSTAPPAIWVGGIPYPVNLAVLSGNTFLSGQVYCFLIQSNVVVGVLTGIPTSAHAVPGSGYHHKHLIAE